MCRWPRKWIILCRKSATSISANAASPTFAQSTFAISAPIAAASGRTSMCSLATGALSKCSCGEKIIVCARVPTEDPSAAGVTRGGRHAARDCSLTTMLCSSRLGWSSLDGWNVLATIGLLACDTCTSGPFPERRAGRSRVRSLPGAGGEKRCILGVMGRLQLRLLGGFDLQAGPGQAVPIRLKKAQALLAYLACHSGQSHPRDKLATLLWPEMDDWQARANLRKVLFVLRPGLSVVSPSLRLDEDTVTLDTAALEVDVLAFQRLARRADREALQQAVDLYRGDLLEGLGVTEAPFEEWLTAERERLRELALEALAKLLAHQTKSEASNAVATALRLLALDPL